MHEPVGPVHFLANLELYVLRVGLLMLTVLGLASLIRRAFEDLRSGGRNANGERHDVSE